MASGIKKLCIKLHLYLGLLSGIIVFIVCITGSAYVFKDEMTNLSRSWRTVEIQNSPVLLPSEVLTIANKETGNTQPTAITYGRPSDAVFVDYFSIDNDLTTVYINQYDGQIIRTELKPKDSFNFFNFVLDGHRTLWMPREIGKPMVGISILIFVIALITGMVMWWPKRWNKRAVRHNFTIKPKRLLLGLHNALGGYFLIVMLTLSFTGLIWSFEWFSQSVYSLSGGGELKPYTLPQSDTLQLNNPSFDNTILDKLYGQLLTETPDATDYYFALPSTNDGVIRVSVAYLKDAYYKTDNLFFDQYTLAPLQGTGPYAGKYADASAADKLRRMNYDIHSGRIWGIWGKIIMFAGSIVGASLPVTGYIIWYRRRFRKRKK